MAARDSLIKRLAKALGQDNQQAIDVLRKINAIAPYPGTKPGDVFFKLFLFPFDVTLPGDTNPTTYLVLCTRGQIQKIRQHAPDYNGVRRALSGCIRDIEKSFGDLDKCLKKAVMDVRSALGLPTRMRVVRGGVAPVGRCDYRDDNNASQCENVSNDTCTIAYGGTWDGTQMCPGTKK